MGEDVTIKTLECSSSFIPLDPIILSTIESMNRAYENHSYPELVLSEEEKQKVYNKLQSTFEEIQIPINGDPIKLIKKLREFNAICDDYYLSINAHPSFRTLTKCVVNESINQIEISINSGSYPRVNIEELMQKSFNTLVIETCTYQRSIR